MMPEETVRDRDSDGHAGEADPPSHVIRGDTVHANVVNILSV